MASPNCSTPPLVGPACLHACHVHSDPGGHPDLPNRWSLSALVVCLAVAYVSSAVLTPIITACNRLQSLHAFPDSSCWLPTGLAALQCLHYLGHRQVNVPLAGLLLRLPLFNTADVHLRTSIGLGALRALCHHGCGQLVHHLIGHLSQVQAGFKVRCLLGQAPQQVGVMLAYRPFMTARGFAISRQLK